jgi:hypothetical protein
LNILGILEAIQTSLHQWYFFDVGFFCTASFQWATAGVRSGGDKPHLLDQPSFELTYTIPGY